MDNGRNNYRGDGMNECIYLVEKIDGVICIMGMSRDWLHYSVWLAWCGIDTETARIRNEVAPDGFPARSITWYSMDGAVKSEKFGIARVAA
jgi:hypothetical protein